MGIRAICSTCACTSSGECSMSCDVHKYDFFDPKQLRNKKGTEYKSGITDAHTKTRVIFVGGTFAAYT